MVNCKIAVIILTYFTNCALPILAKNEGSKISGNEKFEEKTIHALASKLTADEQDEKAKVLAIFEWVATNITYDFEAVFAGHIKNQDATSVFRTRKAVCEGYANLFHELCKKAGIESKVIYGYAKSFGYQPDSQFNISNHSWNAVKINEKWQLLDVTWASPHAAYSITGKSNEINKKYFLTNPTVFVKDHLPEDPFWQFLPSPVTMEDFKKNKIVTEAPSEEKLTAINDSIAFYDKMDAYKREIFYYERVANFNKTNKNAVYRLGIAYLYKSLDTLEVIDRLSYSNIFSELPRLEKQTFELLDKAALYFTQIEEPEESYQQTVELKVETIYQKGVFHYEAAMRMLKLLHDLDENSYRKNYLSYKMAIDKQLISANIYLSQIPESSRYYSEAEEYQEKYIPQVYKMLKQNY